MKINRNQPPKRADHPNGARFLGILKKGRKLTSNKSFGTSMSAYLLQNLYHISGGPLYEGLGFVKYL